MTASQNLRLLSNLHFELVGVSSRTAVPLFCNPMSSTVLGWVRAPECSPREWAALVSKGQMAKELTKIRQLSDISPVNVDEKSLLNREETQVSSWGPQAGSWGFSSHLSSPPNAVLLGSRHFSLDIRLDIVLSYLYKLQRLSGLCLLPVVIRLSRQFVMFASDLLWGSLKEED